MSFSFPFFCGFFFVCWDWEIFVFAFVCHFSCLGGFFSLIVGVLLTLFLFYFTHSYLRGDQDSVRQCPEANHVTWLGNKTIICVKKSTDWATVRTRNGKKYFCHSYSPGCRVPSFFPPWQPEAESILQNYWSVYPLSCSLLLWGSELILSFSASLQCYATVSVSMKWNALT